MFKKLSTNDYSCLILDKWCVASIIIMKSCSTIKSSLQVGMT